MRGVLHCDLKPANVLLASDGTPRISDFGLALCLDEGSGPADNPAGTPAYVAPEQASGKGGPVSPATDVYALGAILYECLTGQPPFKADTLVGVILQVLSEEPVSPNLLQAHLPPDLVTISLCCLRKVPALRYPSAAALANDLRRFGKGEPITAKRLRPRGRKRY
jgi:serine/threonine-protein kinase